MPFRRRREEESRAEALFDPAKVDLVSVSGDGSTVTVSIVPPGPWPGSDEQINSLQEKIHNYVGFILDGQMMKLYPETQGLGWNIAVDCHFGPLTIGRRPFLIKSLQRSSSTAGG